MDAARLERLAAALSATTLARMAGGEMQPGSVKALKRELEVVAAHQKCHVTLSKVLVGSASSFADLVDMHTCEAFLKYKLQPLSSDFFDVRTNISS
jgi:hypothetical protein